MANAITADHLDTSYRETNHLDPRAFAPAKFPTTQQRPSAQAYRQNPLARFFSLMIAARQRQAERDVARYLATTGGKLTDTVEREIQRRLS